MSFCNSMCNKTFFKNYANLENQIDLLKRICQHSELDPFTEDNMPT